LFDTFLDSLKRTMKSRLFPISFIFLILFSVLIHRIFVLQIVKGEEYVEKSEKTSEKTRELKSTRGNIYDRNGVLLAYNEMSYTVTYEDSGDIIDNTIKNAMIHKLINIIEKNDGVIDTQFDIEINKNGEFSFTGDEQSILSFKRDAYYYNKVDDLSEEQVALTAEELFNLLRYNKDKSTPPFEIDKNYTDEEALKIMSIRFAIFMNRYSKYLPITVTTSIDDVTVAAIKENSAELPGVKISQETHRVYNDSEYFAHMLGYTGLISSEKLEELKEAKNTNYSATNQIGKTGIEESFEEYLHGTNGYEKVIVNEYGRVTDIKKVVEPIAGDDVYLTIDAKLQKANYDILEKKITGILLSKIRNSTSTGSKGTSAADILIPIYDVYFALIDNGVIDVDKLDNKGSTYLEKSVYNKFTNKQEAVLADLQNMLGHNSTKLKKEVSDEKKEYLELVYDVLIENEILMNDSIDTNSQKYIDYSKDKISLSNFLQYAISSNWIDLEKLNVGDEYYSSDEIYTELVAYTIKTLKNNQSFVKKLYYYLIYSYKLSGNEICLLLFDQDVLEYNEEDMATDQAKLKSGTVSAYNFIRTKLKNLEITPAQLALEPCSGSIVVTDVKNGDVLALVTYPSYDNNKLANSIDADYYASLNNNGFPLLNRPLQQRTAPGSTYKVVTAIAGLEEHIINPGDTIYSNVVFKKITPSPKCWSKVPHGDLDIPHAIEVSCNYFFYELGYRLSSISGSFKDKTGLDKLRKYASMFGLDAKSGIELPEYAPEISSESSVRSAIGQGSNNFAPVQLSRYITAVANKGNSYNLTIVDQVKDLEGNVVLDNKASILNKIDISDSVWSQVQQGLYLVVNGSHSSILSLFSNLNVEVAGKTGTAEESKLKPNHALFLSYAPFDSPEISVTTVIPNGYSSSNAAELASDVYKYYFDKNN
jgi:penicillin-binding protein 2